MSRFRAFRVVVAAVVVVPLVVAVSAVPTFAAGCHGSGCDGRNPETSGCAADAATIGRLAFQDNASGGTFGRQVVELRYSRRCNASWSRVTATAGGTAAVTSSSAYVNGFTSSTSRARSGSGAVYSRMRGGSTVKACGRSSFNHGAVVMARCTARR